MASSVSEATDKSEVRTNLSINIAPNGSCTTQEGSKTREHADIFAAREEDPRVRAAYHQLIGGLVAITKGTLEAVEERLLTPFSRVLAGKFGATCINIFTQKAPGTERTYAVQVLLHSSDGQLVDCYVRAPRQLRRFDQVLHSALTCFTTTETA